MARFPTPAPTLEPERMLGAWYVLVSNQEFWRKRTHPRIEHDPLDEQCQRSSIRFRQADLLGRAQRRAIHGVDTCAEPGVYRWRGHGILRLVECRWCVPIVDPEYRWAVAWFGPVAFGLGPGLAIHTRDPCVPQALLDEVLALVRSHPFLGSRCQDLYAPVQDWFPPEPYRLG